MKKFDWDINVLVSTRKQKRKCDGAIFKMISADFRTNRITMKEQGGGDVTWSGSSQEFVKQFETVEETV